MEPPHTQRDPLWLTAYLFFEGHVYGEAADRLIAGTLEQGQEHGGD
jgi:hypothetical protein